MSEMDAYREIFSSESAEFLQAITDGLIALEANPHDREPVETIFRGAHSLKGMSAAMGYERSAELTHTMENLMDLVRRGERAADAPLIDLMLEAADLVRDLIADEMAGASAVDSGPVADRLAAAIEGVAAGPVPVEVEGDDDSDVHLVPEQGESDGVLVADPLQPGESLFRVKVTLEQACVLKAVRAYMVLKRLAHMGAVIETVPPARDIEDERFDRDFTAILRTHSALQDVRTAALGVSEVEDVVVEAYEIEQGPAEQPTATETVPAPMRKRAKIPKLAETQTVRIAIGHLDKIVDLVGELVILRSRLDRLSRHIGDHELDQAVERLHGVAGELQHEVMHARMVPVGNIFNRFPRMVRDLTRDLGKEIDFRMEGLDIELDRTVLDEIGDPIVHLLRNSIDHGIEEPEAREAAGKPRQGTVRLTATRDRDQVRITVGDDGRGIDPEKVWQKACTLGLVEEAARDSYRDDEVLLFTCVPGFSTAERATKVSGRGVGMDVVKGKIEHLGGSVNIYSIPGMGTEVLLTLPLTLAIIQALLVATHGQTYAVPLGSVDEVMSPHEVRVDTVDDAPVLVFRDGKVLPLFRLDALLGIEPERHMLPRPGERIVLIADNVGIQRGLVVGEMIGSTEIVVKPMSRMFRSVRGLGGATILGDGRVAFILDPRTIFPGREEYA